MKCHILKGNDTALTLYLGIGVILGCAIMLASNFDLAMAIGGGISILSIAIHSFCMWKTGQLIRKHDEGKNE